MDIFSVLRSVFASLGRIMSFGMNINGFYFTIGQMIVGLIIISLSVLLLRKLFDKE